MVGKVYSILFSLLLFPTCLMADDYNYPWKKGHNFEIYRIDNLKTYYTPGELIDVTVSGRSNLSRVSPTPENGFSVQAWNDYTSDNNIRTRDWVTVNYHRSSFSPRGISLIGK